MFLNLLSAYSGTQTAVDENGEEYTQYIYDDIWTSFAKDGLGYVLLWLVVAFAVVLLAVGIFIRIKRADFFRTYVKYAVAFATGLAVVILVAMLSLEFFDMSESGSVFELVLVPSAVLFGVVVLGTAATYVASLYSKKAFKISLWTTLGVFAAAVIALIVCISVYYSSGQAAENNWADPALINDLGLYLAMAGLIVALALSVPSSSEERGQEGVRFAHHLVCGGVHRHELCALLPRAHPPALRRLRHHLRACCR